MMKVQTEFSKDTVWLEFSKDTVWLSDKFYGELIKRIFVGVYLGETSEKIKAQIYGEYSGPLISVLLRGGQVKKQTMAGPVGKLP